MIDWVVHIIDRGGYSGIAVLMFVENIVPIIPSEVIIPFSGFAASRSGLTLWGVIAAGTAGSVMGQLPIYYAARFLGEARIERLADRYGRWLTIGSAEVRRAGQWFDQRGGVAVAICRVIPGMRSLISIPAGVRRMNLIRFILYSTLGMFVWTFALAYAGHLLGKNYDKVSKYLGPTTYILVGVAGVVVLGVVLERHRRGLGRRRGAGEGHQHGGAGKSDN